MLQHLPTLGLIGFVLIALVIYLNRPASRR